MRDQFLLALILSLSATGCNSFEGLTGKKSSSDEAAVTASGDAAKVDDKKSKSCPAETKGEDDGEYSEDKEAEKKAEKGKEKGDDDAVSLTHDGAEHEECETEKSETEKSTDD